MERGRKPKKKHATRAMGSERVPEMQGESFVKKPNPNTEGLMHRGYRKDAIRLQ